VRVAAEVPSSLALSSPASAEIIMPSPASADIIMPSPASDDIVMPSFASSVGLGLSVLQLSWPWTLHWPLVLVKSNRKL
jgi:hypothetical protein